MTQRQANWLLGLIAEERPRLQVEIRRLGNGECVCCLKKEHFYIWSHEDWERCRSQPPIARDMAVVTEK